MRNNQFVTGPCGDGAVWQNRNAKDASIAPLRENPHATGFTLRYLALRISSGIWIYFSFVQPIRFEAKESALIILRSASFRDKWLLSTQPGIRFGIGFSNDSGSSPANTTSKMLRHCYLTMRLCARGIFPFLPNIVFIGHQIETHSCSWMISATFGCDGHFFDVSPSSNSTYRCTQFSAIGPCFCLSSQGRSRYTALSVSPRFRAGWQNNHYQHRPPQVHYNIPFIWLELGDDPQPKPRVGISMALHSV